MTREAAAILGARWDKVPERHRPHYVPEQRFRILCRAQWELPGAVARRNQSPALGFLLNPRPGGGNSVMVPCRS